MTKKTEYQVVFSYDLHQTGKVKYDTYLTRAIEKIGGSLVNKYEEDFGSIDLTLSVHSDLPTLQRVVKEVLHDLENKHVKLNASAQKVQHFVNVDTQQFTDFPSFEALASKWASEKLGQFENQGSSVNIVLPSKELTEEFIKNVLPQTVVFTKDNQTPTAYADMSREPVINADNYNNKRKSSLSA